MNEPLTKKDLEPIQGQLQSFTKQLNRIELALMGDEAIDMEGLVAKVKKHDQHINKWKIRAAWGTGAAGGFGFMLHQLWQWLKS